MDEQGFKVSRLEEIVWIRLSEGFSAGVVMRKVGFSDSSV